MKVPIRIKTVEKSNVKTNFCIWKGIKTIVGNFGILFTRPIVSNSYGWVEKSSTEKIVHDVSLVLENGEAKFMKTPEDTDAVLEITQTL